MHPGSRCAVWALGIAVLTLGSCTTRVEVSLKDAGPPVADASPGDTFVYEAADAGHWVFVAGGASDDRALDVVYDWSGATGSSFYLTGRIDTGAPGSTVTFGDVSAQGHGGYDIFVVELDLDSGRPARAVLAGGSGDDLGSALAVDQTEKHLYVAGCFSGAASFGAASLTAQPGNDCEAFVARMDTGLKSYWARSLQVVSSQVDVVAAGGDVFAVHEHGRSKLGNWGVELWPGLASGPGGLHVSLDALGHSSAIFVAAGPASPALERLDTTSGATVWSKVGPCGPISADYKGIYVYAAWNGISKLDMDGNVYWSNDALPVEPQSIVADAQYGEGVYFAGTFSGTVTLGSITLTSKGKEDIVVGKLGDTGKVEWAISAGGPGSDRAGAIAFAPLGELLVAGTFCGTATFGEVKVTGGPGTSIFVTRVSTMGGFI
jgi:hypothetical protein